MVSNVAGGNTSPRHVVRLALLLETAMDAGMDMKLFTSCTMAGDACEILIEICGEVSVDSGLISMFVEPCLCSNKLKPPIRLWSVAAKTRVNYFPVMTGRWTGFRGFAYAQKHAGVPPPVHLTPAPRHLAKSNQASSAVVCTRHEEVVSPQVWCIRLDEVSAFGFGRGGRDRPFCRHVSDD